MSTFPADFSRHARDAYDRATAPEDHEAIVQRMQWLADMMDNRFTIPGTGVRFGLDSILGLVPVAGDTAGTLISAYIVVEAARMGVSPWTLARMILNLMIDWLIGIVPGIGDLLDVGFKANQRNLRLLGIEPKQR